MRFDGAISIKSSSADEFPGFAPARRSRVWPFITACLIALFLTCFTMAAGVVMVAVALFNGLGDVLGLAFYTTWIFTALVLLPTLAELLWLLQTGQYVQLAMDILGLLSGRGPQ